MNLAITPGDRDLLTECLEKTRNDLRQAALTLQTRNPMAVGIDKLRDYAGKCERLRKRLECAV